MHLIIIKKGDKKEINSNCTLTQNESLKPVKSYQMVSFNYTKQYFN